MIIRIRQMIADTAPTATAYATYPPHPVPQKYEQRIDADVISMMDAKKM